MVVAGLRRKRTEPNCRDSTDEFGELMKTSEQHTILFVDDDEELRAIVHDQLTSAGYEVDEAQDGLEAIGMIRTRTYDVLLLDITLPGKSGLEVLTFARNHSPCSKVIMLTGIVGLGTAIDSLTRGASDYITKPYALEHLLGSIRMALGESQTV